MKNINHNGNITTKPFHCGESEVHWGCDVHCIVSRHWHWETFMTWPLCIEEVQPSTKLIWARVDSRLGDEENPLVSSDDHSVCSQSLTDWAIRTYCAVGTFWSGRVGVHFSECDYPFNFLLVFVALVHLVFRMYMICMCLHQHVRSEMCCVMYICLLTLPFKWFIACI